MLLVANDSNILSNGNNINNIIKHIINDMNFNVASRHNVGMPIHRLIIIRIIFILIMIYCLVNLTHYKFGFN